MKTDSRRMTQTDTHSRKLKPLSDAALAVHVDLLICPRSAPPPCLLCLLCILRIRCTLATHLTERLKGRRDEAEWKRVRSDKRGCEGCVVG